MKYKNVTEIQLTGKMVKKIGYKPYLSHIICLLVTILLCATMNKLCIIVAVFILTMNMTGFIFIKDYSTMNIYDNGILIFDPENNNLGYFLPYDNINCWTAKKDKNHTHCIYIKQNDGSEIIVDTFQNSKAFHSLNKYIENKEINYLEGKTIGRLFDFKNNNKK